MHHAHSLMPLLLEWATRMSQSPAHSLVQPASANRVQAILAHAPLHCAGRQHRQVSQQEPPQPDAFGADGEPFGNSSLDAGGGSSEWSDFDQEQERPQPAGLDTVRRYGSVSLAGVLHLCLCTGSMNTFCSSNTAGVQGTAVHMQPCDLQAPRQASIIQGAGPCVGPDTRRWVRWVCDACCTCMPSVAAVVAVIADPEPLGIP